MLEENRSATADVVIGEEADFGVAFDGDFDSAFCLIKVVILFLENTS